MGSWFNFTGRIGRKNWWIRQIVATVTLGVLLFAALAAADLPEGGAETGGSLAAVILIVVMLGSLLVSAWISISCSVKRLHDLGYTGWLVVALIFVTVGMSSLGSQWETFASVINLVATAWLGFFPGVKGPNDYGVPEDWCGKQDLCEEVK